MGGGGVVSFFVCNKFATNHLEMRWCPPHLEHRSIQTSFAGLVKMILKCAPDHVLCLQAVDEAIRWINQCRLSSSTWLCNLLLPTSASMGGGGVVSFFVCNKFATNHLEMRWCPPHLEHRSIQTSFAGLVKMILKCVPDHIYIYISNMIMYMTFHQNDTLDLNAQVNGARSEHL